MSFPPLFVRIGRVGLAVFALLFVAALRAQSSESSQAKGGKSGTEGRWKSLFDGETIAGWKQSGFYGEGAVKVDKSFQNGGGAIVIEKGSFLSGITWKDDADLPSINYEIALDAMRLDGSDFFCALTFPVGKSACTFVVGGWGGTVVGLSSVDDMDASENETGQGMEVRSNRWYRIRVRVTDEKIEAWIDEEKMVDLETKDRKISLRFGDIDNSLPLGIASYQTRAAVRDIRLRRL